jgi:hypothetical protein
MIARGSWLIDDERKGIRKNTKWVSPLRWLVQAGKSPFAGVGSAVEVGYVLPEGAHLGKIG